MELIESFNKEVTIAYKMRKETRHVVTIYGFDFDAQRGLALLAMELGGESLSKRIIRLHRMKNMERRRHRPDGMMQTGGDFISPRERKNIWVQLADIVQALHRHHVVSKCK
jgi:serine/threonine protein kinase